MTDSSAGLEAGKPTEDERGERRGRAPNGREKRSHGHEARQTSRTLSESKVHTKGLIYISKATTTSFLGPEGLEESNKRFPTRTAVNVP